jgi:hypothetical protein
MTTTKKMKKFLRKVQMFQRELKVNNSLSTYYDEDGLWVVFSIRMSENEFDTLYLYGFFEPEENEKNLDDFINEHREKCPTF